MCDALGQDNPLNHIGLAPDVVQGLGSAPNVYRHLSSELLIFPGYVTYPPMPSI